MATFKADLYLGRRVPLIEGADFANNAITTDKIDDKAVTTEKLADGAITKEKVDQETIETLSRKLIALTRTVETIDERSQNTEKQSDANKTILEADNVIIKSLQEHGLPTPINYGFVFLEEEVMDGLTKNNTIENVLYFGLEEYEGATTSYDDTTGELTDSEAAYDSTTGQMTLASASYDSSTGQLTL